MRNPRKLLSPEGDYPLIHESDFITVNDIKLMFESILGSGSYGCVYKVNNTRANEKYALKIGVEGLNVPLNEEFRITEYINSKLPEEEKKRIMKTYFTFKFGKRTCILYELLSLNLYQIICYKGFTPLPLINVQIIARNVAEGLKSLHSINIVHLDIKPENIMFSDKEFVEVKIGDFGCSTFIEKVREQLRNQNNNIVSRYYRPPEVVLSLESDTKIDVWSFGCLLAELSTGNVLYPGQNDLHLLRLIQDRARCGIPDEMIKSSKMKSVFFDEDNYLISEKDYLYENKFNNSSEEVESIPNLKESGFFSWTIDEFIDNLVSNCGYPENEAGINLLKDLLKHTLKINPNDRYTIQEVLEHDYFKFEFKQEGI